VAVDRFEAVGRRRRLVGHHVHGRVYENPRVAAAIEAPDLLTADVRAFFSPLR